MPPTQQIQINTLLLQREELFVRIHELERAAAAILGEPYPFTRPALPSDARPKRKPIARAASDRSGGFQPPSATRESLRHLEGLETAYRVTYIRHGQTVTEEHDAPAALRTLLAAQTATLIVTRLETIDLAGRPQSVLLDSAS